jgi:branched-chain amino acid transport system permease protein
MNRATTLGFWVLGALMLALFPHLAGVYYANFFINFGIVALFAVSYNLLLGYTGLLSFGHAIYFGAGGYGTALALEHIEGLALIPALLIGVFSSIILAVILSPIVARLKAAAFAMLHLAFNYIVYILVLKLRNITGGEDGISGYDIPPLNLGLITLDMSDPTVFFYFASVILVGSIYLAWFFTKTPFGQIIIGIRDNDMAHAFQPILATIVGGASSFFGPIAGAAIFSALEEITSRFTEQVELVNGLVMILVIIYFPMGFMGLIAKAKEKLLKKKPTQKAMEPL